MLFWLITEITWELRFSVQNVPPTPFDASVLTCEKGQRYPYLFEIETSPKYFTRQFFDAARFVNRYAISSMDIEENAHAGNATQNKQPHLMQKTRIDIQPNTLPHSYIYTLKIHEEHTRNKCGFNRVMCAQPRSYPLCSPFKTYSVHKK